MKLTKRPGQWYRAFCAGLILGFSLWSAGAPANVLPPYPGAERVSEQQDNQVDSRRLIMGALKKVNNVMEPERVEYVRGTRHTTTWHVPGETRTQRVIDYYRPRLMAAGEILFECAGRSCGSSNYWANGVFARSILYGPEQHQYYMLARMHVGGYLAIYIAMRGTREIYVHSAAVGLLATDVQQKMESPGRFVFVDEDVAAVVASVTALLEETPDVRLRLIVHQRLKPGQSVEQSIESAARRADKVLGSLLEAGIPADQVEATGLGPLAPDSKYAAERMEILIPSRLETRQQP